MIPFLLLSLLLIFPTQVMTEKYLEGVNLRNSGPVYVRVTDSARGGETAPSFGDEAGKGIILEVSVNALRHSQFKACFGNISVEFFTAANAHHKKPPRAHRKFTKIKKCASTYAVFAAKHI